LPDNAQPSAAEMIEAAQGILAKGRQVIPLPGAGEKGIHPPGLTGYLGQPATMAQLRKWIEHGFKAYEQSPGGSKRVRVYQVGALGIRMATDELALDVDDYDGKRGGRALAEMEAGLGPLPPCPVSTARRPDDLVSGIRPFSVPADQGRQGRAATAAARFPAPRRLT
jgi:hypothetical protein